MSQNDGKKDVIYMVAHLQKRSRGRSMLTLFSNWNARKTCLHVSKKMTYWEGDTLKGEMSLEGASTRLIHPSDADGKMYAFEVLNKDGESVMFCTDSDEITTAWMSGIAAVVNGTWNNEKIDISHDHAQLANVQRALESLREEIRATTVKNKTELQTLRLEFASTQEKTASTLETLKKNMLTQSQSVTTVGAPTPVVVAVPNNDEISTLRNKFEAQFLAFQTKITSEVETLRQENLTLKAELQSQSQLMASVTSPRLPVGTVQAFHGNETTRALLSTNGWAICDGTTPESQGIQNSILTTIPNLTDERYLLRGCDPTQSDTVNDIDTTTTTTVVVNVTSSVGDDEQIDEVEKALKSVNVEYIILVK